MADNPSVAYWKKRESEKSVLLSISEQLARIKEPNDLFEIVLNTLQPVFKFDQAAVVYFNDEQTHSRHLFHFDPNQTRDDDQPFYDQLFGDEIPLSDSVHQEIVNAETPKLIYWEYLEDRYGNSIGVQGARQFGFRELLFIPLRYADKGIGTFDLLSTRRGCFDQDKMPLYQNIGNQVAVAVSNLIANEKVRQAMDEIKRLNQKLQHQNDYLEEEIQSQYGVGSMITESPIMKNVLQNVQLVAKTDTTVLVTGESGTGKELIARAIHEGSDRKGQSLIKMNCAALPAQLIESELFGHEKGAFTGAIDQRIGKFELASGSTLFLDEIGELPLDLQAKLLRVLQEKEIERLGSNKTIQTDVRIVSATNRNLLKEVEEGRFRSDLYYRLNVFPIQLPPLRERKEEIPALANHFLQKKARKLGKSLKGFSAGVLKQMTAYSWPGNIRELEHVIERSAILTQEPTIKNVQLSAGKRKLSEEIDFDGPITTLAENERRHIMKALAHCNWKVSGVGGAAELLDMKPSTLEFRMKKLGIKRQFVS